MPFIIHQILLSICYVLAVRICIWINQTVQLCSTESSVKRHRQSKKSSRLYNLINIFFNYSLTPPTKKHLPSMSHRPRYRSQQTKASLIFDAFMMSRLPVIPQQNGTELFEILSHIQSNLSLGPKIRSEESSEELPLFIPESLVNTCTSGSHEAAQMNPSRRLYSGP